MIDNTIGKDLGEADKKLLTNLYCFLALEHNFQKGMDGEILTAKECYDMAVAHESDDLSIVRYELSYIFKNHINEAIKYGLFQVVLPEVYQEKTYDVLEKNGFTVLHLDDIVIISWEEETND